MKCCSSLNLGKVFVTINVIIYVTFAPQFEQNMLCSALESLLAKLHRDSQNETYKSGFKNLRTTLQIISKNMDGG